MNESVTYQAIVEEGVVKGEVKGMLRNLLQLGRRRFGEPNPDTEAALAALPIRSVSRVSLTRC